VTSPAPHPALLALAGDGLPGRRSLDVDALERRLDEVEGHGLAGVLLQAHEAGRAPLGSGAVGRLRERIDAEAQLAVRLEAELLRLGPTLTRHGGVVLKGAALAHGANADPALRPSSDLDLLVAPASVDLVLRDLARLGYERPRPDPAPGYAARVAKATTVVHPTGLLVDLHRTLTLGAAGELVDVDEVLAGRIEVPAGPVTVPAPSWPVHLVVVALHAVVGDGLRRPRSLRDVAVVAHHPEQDPRAALDIARRWGVAPTVAVALRAATDLLGAALPDELAAVAATAPTTAVRAGAAASEGARHRLDQLGSTAGWQARATLTRSLVAPSPAFLRWTYGDRPLPTLYARRWRDLCSRTAEASSVGSGVTS
jgi:hypothetical protein